MKGRKQEEDNENKIVEVTFDTNDENLKINIRLIHTYSKKTKDLSLREKYIN
jgi:hypothetical protein